VIEDSQYCNKLSETNNLKLAKETENANKN
jgi:hypothetical protein